GSNPDAGEAPIGAGATLLGLARSRGLWHWTLSILAGLALGMTLGTVAWLALGAEVTRPPEHVVVTIPSDTAQRIAAGAPAPVIPADLQLVEGDTLVLQNADAFAHRIGGYTLAPGATLRIPVEAADGGTFACTFHASGSIALDVRPRNEPSGVVAAGLLLGLPLGLVLGGVSWVVRKLDDPGVTASSPEAERVDPRSF
ncbi:MAG: hypothetical protein Q7S35_06310, partial [Candidatus Limnocylindrales bacterium]|nr:hypothetical protein [Candidatus Limnocylindrales bacterium]